MFINEFWYIWTVTIQVDISTNIEKVYKVKNEIVSRFSDENFDGISNSFEENSQQMTEVDPEGILGLRYSMKAFYLG